MTLGELIKFKEDIYFDGAVQIDWFYNQSKANLVATNFVFHGSEYYGVENGIGLGNKRIDTISLTLELCNKLVDEKAKPLSLAIADYGTGKSHYAVTLAQLFSGSKYMTRTYEEVIDNIAKIDVTSANKIKNVTNESNLVIVLNGMRDFNLHAEILKATKRSLELYGVSTDKLLKLNRALETANIFFSRNANKLTKEFEIVAKKYNWTETGSNLISKIEKLLMTDEDAFNIVNSVYLEVNGQEIAWDEGLSANSILELVINEYCGMNGQFSHVILLFDEFGRYLEYASNVNPTKSGESALQQIFELAQNYEGTLQVINFIQSDIKTYLQRIDQTRNISRYIGRYDSSDKYYISSNLETVFANLIERTDNDIFSKYIIYWQSNNEKEWQDCFNNLNKWASTRGVWSNYNLFRKVVVEGIYPLHPFSTYVLTQLSDYLQNRSSLALMNEFISKYQNVNLDEKIVLIRPEELMKGNLFIELLASEQEGRQASQQCIMYSNVLRKYSDKLSEKSLTILRSNLVIRLLRFRTISYDDALLALSICSGLNIATIKEELVWLENEYAILEFDPHANRFDFKEDSSGAIDYRVLKKRLIAKTNISSDYLNSPKIKNILGVLDLVTTNFGINHKIVSNEWNFVQDLFPIEELTIEKITAYIANYEQATKIITPKGMLVWLYCNKDTDSNIFNKIYPLLEQINNKPIVFLLINDVDNKFLNSLIEFKVLDELDDVNRKKYERYFFDDFEQVELNLRTEFDEYKKERLQVTTLGINQIKERMSSFLTNLYEQIYSQTIPFFFDGLLTKNNTLSTKAQTFYCSILKMLMTGQVNYEAIHNFSSEIRNRIEALFLSSTNTSWKCINSNYQLMTPQEIKVKSIYDDILSQLQAAKEYNCEKLYNKYSKPPFGLADEVITMLLGVICSLNGYCLRFKLANQTYTLNGWKDQIILNDKQVKIDERIKKSTILFIDMSEVVTKFKNLFTAINNNNSIFEVQRLDKNLLNLTSTDDVPQELSTEYLLAKQKLTMGLSIKANWDKSINQIEDKLYSASDKNDFYEAISALALIISIDIVKIFNLDYLFDDLCKEEWRKEYLAIVDYISKHIDDYVESMTCRKVEAINTFRNHNNKIEEILKNAKLYDYAEKIAKRRDFILNNMENVKNAQMLRSNLDNYIINTNDATKTTYSNMVALKKKGNELLEQIDKYKSVLGSDYDKYKNTIQLIIKDLTDTIKMINNQISEIWDSLYDARTYNDLIKIEPQIDIVIRKGIREDDYDSLMEVKENIRDLLIDLNEYLAFNGSRVRLKEISQQLIDKYNNSNFDFDVVTIIETIISEKKQEEEWIDKYSDVKNLSRQELLEWLEKTKNYPNYLSEKSIITLNNLRNIVLLKVKTSKIDDVVYYFSKLDYSERKECLTILNKLIEK